MRTKKQITQFFSGVRPASEQDDQQIKRYFLYRVGKITLGESPDLPSVTFDQAVHWSKMVFPAPGAVIVWGSERSIGVVAKEDWNSYTLAAVLTPGKALTTQETTLDTEQWELASDHEAERMQRALSEAGFDWNVYKYSLERRNIPQNPKFVRLMVMGVEKGYGIFKEVADDGKLHMHCCKFGDGEIRYKEAAVLDCANDYSLYDAYNVHRAAIFEDLTKDNLVWSAKLKRLYSTSYRLKPGSRYFYLDTYWLVFSTVDKGKQKDDMRFYKGNYFHTQEEATRFRDFVVSSRREQIGEGIDCE